MSNRQEKNELKLIIGKQLRQARTDHDLSIQEIVEDLGVGRQTIWKYEKGIILPSLPMLIRLADFFNTTTDWFLGRD